MKSFYLSLICILSLSATLALAQPKPAKPTAGPPDSVCQKLLEKTARALAKATLSNESGKPVSAESVGIEKDEQQSGDLTAYRVDAYLGDREHFAMKISVDLREDGFCIIKSITDMETFD